MANLAALARLTEAAAINCSHCARLRVLQQLAQLLPRRAKPERIDAGYPAPPQQHLPQRQRCSERQRQSHLLASLCPAVLALHCVFLLMLERRLNPVLCAMGTAPDVALA
jgi:hypothetical protein